MLIGPWGLALAIGWPTLMAITAVGIGRATKLGETVEERRLKAREEYLASCLSGDTRKMHQAGERYIGATNLRLVADLGDNAPAAWRGR